MLKFIADECINWDIVVALREQGFDVLTIKEAKLTGADDDTVFSFACTNKRILLTFDRGFGDIFRFNISKSYGLMIVLISQMNKKEIIDIPLNFISIINKRGDNLRGKLIIIGKTKIRISQR